MSCAGGSIRTRRKLDIVVPGRAVFSGFAEIGTPSPLKDETL
jgi:hypothetical protein